MESCSGLGLKQTSTSGYSGPPWKRHGRENKRKTSVLSWIARNEIICHFSLWCVRVCVCTWACMLTHRYRETNLHSHTGHTPYSLTQYPKAAVLFNKESFGKISISWQRNHTTTIYPKSFTSQSSPLININQSPRTISHWRKSMLGKSHSRRKKNIL